eukprot:5355861-Heterocapsa_arctica.AAC.1
MTVCSQKTAARILEFIKPSLQLPGPVWMANRIERPFERAVEAYAAHIKNYGLEKMRFAGRSGAGSMEASSSFKPTTTAVEGDMCPAA